MKITAIKPQIKRAGRFSVFVDGKFAFGLGTNDLLALKLTINQEITELEFEELKRTSDLGKIYEKTLNLLSIRPRSEWEIRDYLKRKNSYPALVDEILNKLSDSGYIDDKKFAEAWVNNRRLLKPISKLKLRAELKQKRIEISVIDEVLKQDETDELKVLKELVERKAKRYPDNQKLMAYLARQGFKYEDIKSILSEEL